MHAGMTFCATDGVINLLPKYLKLITALRAPFLIKY